MKTRCQPALALIVCLLATCCTSILSAQKNEAQKNEAQKKEAQENGREKLDRAMLAKLSARSFAQRDQVIQLARAAVDAGLAGDDLKFANFLIAAALTERATILSRDAFDRPQISPQWQKIRQQAILDLIRAIKADRSIAQSHFLLGRYLAQRGGDRKRAIAAFDEAIRLDEDNQSVRARALVYRANLRTDAKKRLSDYNEAIELAPGDALAIRSRGVFYLSQKKLDEAQADLKAALVLDENDDESHMAFGLAQMFGGKFVEARKSFDRVIELTPEATMAYVHRARCNALTGNNEAALADVGKAIALSPTNLAALMLRARLLASRGDVRLARADVDRVLKLAPNSTGALMLRASIKANEKDNKGAIADVEAALRIRPDDVDGLLRAALLYTILKRSDKAVDTYSQVIRLAPDRWTAYRGRGDAYLGMGRQAKAVADYAAALKIDPKQPGVLNNLAWVLSTSPDEKLRDGARAIELAEKACDLTDFKQAHIISTLAAGYAETGDFDNAVKWSKRAIEVGDASLKGPLRKELASYLEKKPWRELKKQDRDAVSDGDRNEKDDSAKSDRDGVKR